MIKQYLYISTAPGLSDEQVEAIVDESARNNTANAVTGLLFYNGRNFLQLFEGDGETVDALMVRIKNDPRHDGFSVLYEGEASGRACPGWAMKRIKTADSAPIRRETLEEILPGNLKDDLRKMVLNYATLN